MLHTPQRFPARTWGGVGVLVGVGGALGALASRFQVLPWQQPCLFIAQADAWWGTLFGGWLVAILLIVCVPQLTRLLGRWARPALFGAVMTVYLVDLLLLLTPRLLVLCGGGSALKSVADLLTFLVFGTVTVLATFRVAQLRAGRR
jgi:hypothetical protein